MRKSLFGFGAINVPMPWSNSSSSMISGAKVAWTDFDSSFAMTLRKDFADGRWDNSRRSGYVWSIDQCAVVNNIVAESVDSDFS
jgi:hypothetical protein